MSGHDIAALIILAVGAVYCFVQAWMDWRER